MKFEEALVLMRRGLDITHPELEDVKLSCYGQTLYVTYSTVDINKVVMENLFKDGWELVE